MSKLKAVDVTLTIGIGTGDTGQFLALDKDSSWWILDTYNEIDIKLSNPDGLRRTLNDQHRRGEL